MIRKLVARLGGVSFWLRVSAVLTLIALALMVWSVLEPTPLPVMLAMTLGQGIGTLAFAIFGFIVFKDLTRTRRARRDSLENIGLKAMQTIALTKDGLSPRDSLQNIALTNDQPTRRDSLQDIALTKDEPAPQNIALTKGEPAPGDSLQNIALTKDES